MKLLSERLKWAMEEKSKRDGEEVIPADVARAAGVSATSANYWLNDNNGMNAARARPIAEFLGVDPLWLETGIGTPKKEGELTVADELDAIVRLISMYKECSAQGREAILSAAASAVKHSASNKARVTNDKSKPGA